MVLDALEQILQQMGERLNCDLELDEKGCCLITLPEGIQVQIDPSQDGKRMILGTLLGSVPVGKYRENLLRAALQANHVPPPQFGTLAYSTQKDVLVLLAQLDIEGNTGDKVLDFLGPFATRAHEWLQAIRNGEVPVVAGVTPKKAEGGLFGLMP